MEKYVLTETLKHFFGYYFDLDVHEKFISKLQSNCPNLDVKILLNKYIKYNNYIGKYYYDTKMIKCRLSHIS